MLALRNSLPRDEIEAMSMQICARFQRHDRVREAESVMIFLSFGSEVNTDPLIEGLWREGKRVLAPACIPESRDMAVFEMTSFGDVAPGHFGIREPRRNILQPLDKACIDLVAVPALAFDRRGYRVGYGGGYYDRFLTGMRALKIGLAFSCQILQEVPAEALDQPVDGIVTERECIRARGPSAGGGSFSC